MALSPLPILLAFSGTDVAFSAVPTFWRIGAASLAATGCFICAITLFRRPGIGKIFGYTSSICGLAAIFPYVLKNPFAALIATVTFAGTCFALLDFKPDTNTDMESDHAERCLQRARWAAAGVPIVIIVYKVSEITYSVCAISAVAASSVIAQTLFAHWSIENRSNRYLFLPFASLASFISAFLLSVEHHIAILALLISILNLMVLSRYGQTSERREYWWDVLLNHPARILFVSFLALCVSGTILLSLPISVKTGTINIVDAAFTSVSAVCVTGLIVLDTPNYFSHTGQFFIMLLIQLGGLGIMSIATVSLYAIGRRLSLKQEYIMTSITDTDHQDLFDSLVTILKFTFIAEGTGALLLTILFYMEGDAPSYACWRGTFTAVSAFCNAGFALQSDSLMSYRSNPMILHTVAVLIIFGGMAPATGLLVPRWLARKHIPVPARIALITTVVLLFSGTFFILAFEWNGVLAGLSVFDKIQNAWFQSVTLRTAGFNSVGISHLAGPTFLVMIFFMFVGGSPGGTAGGVKTTTIGILAMTFWTNVANRNNVTTKNRRILHTTVYRAITIVVSGVILWFVLVLMMEATQHITASKVVFEVTSAIGTVGLSMGATASLDQIGKLIIMVAMFAGRIGPMTLFMLLGEDRSSSAPRYPEAKISLT